MAARPPVLALLPNHDDPDITGTLTRTVKVDEEDARQAVRLQLAIGDLQGLATTEECGAQVRVTVP